MQREPSVAADIDECVTFGYKGYLDWGACGPIGQSQGGVSGN